MNITSINKFSLKKHPDLNEKWVQDILANNPSMLGLGDIILKDKERSQPKAGRLDLLFQDIDSGRRYEVEVQLGATDEAHIIRTLEYWDIERKRYPQYEHTAVIVAEDITSRFLNVVSLFNGSVPLIAIQMNAVEVDGSIGLFFTTVLDQLNLGLVDDDEEVQEITDRSYWESRSSKELMSVVDKIFEIAKDIDPGIEPNYNKHYIGMTYNGKSVNHFTVRPRKTALRLNPRIASSEDSLQMLENLGLDVLDHKYGRYRINIKPSSFGDISAAVATAIKLAMGLPVENAENISDPLAQA